MEKSLNTAGESTIGPACIINYSEKPVTGPLVIEVVQYDDELLIGSDEVVTFDVSSWSADRFRQFWEFMHNPDVAVGGFGGPAGDPTGDVRISFRGEN
jgi:hypothetical protein